MFFSYNIFIYIQLIDLSPAFFKKCKKLLSTFCSQKNTNIILFKRLIKYKKMCVATIGVQNFFPKELLLIFCILKDEKNYKTTNLIESQSILELNLSGILERCQKTPL